MMSSEEGNAETIGKQTWQPKRKRPRLFQVTGRIVLNSPPPKSAHNQLTFCAAFREWHEQAEIGPGWASRSHFG
jgi:hypothetical protein